MPVLGPVDSSSTKALLDPLVERYRVISYADDIKPAVTSMAEFSIINDAAALFESGQVEKQFTTRRLTEWLSIHGYGWCYFEIKLDSF